MKQLIILAGLPATGKSYTARLLNTRIKNSLYFDSDLFSKNYAKDHSIDFTNLSNEEQLKKRIIFHKAKIDALIIEFQKYDTIILDTCFDIVETRKLFYNLENQNIKLIIVELKCSEKTIIDRIFNKPHESHRMVGDQETRLKIYKIMKSKWSNISNVYFVIDTDKNISIQLSKLIDSL
jgi:tRNA uridine 5-carbamoylmethylation protein Kti12